MLARSPYRRASLVVLVAMAFISVSCSRSSQGAQSGLTGTTSSTCPGQPLLFTAILSLTGPLAVPGLATEIENATNAALKAVNDQCALGRPVAVKECDDKSDPNVAQQCGLEAKSDGSLALFGSSGTFTNGTSAAQLPGVFTAGGTLFDLTNPESFSSTSALTLVVAGGSVAAGLHKTQNTFVVVDTAATRAFSSIAQEVAKSEGVKLDLLFVPADTTDYAPLAAQVMEGKPQSIGLVLPDPVPFMNALASEGITAKSVPILTAVTLMPPAVLHQLGSVANGMYLLTQQAPPSDSSNPGIRQMLKELREAGFNANGNDLSPASTAAWSNVHALVAVLEKLPKSEIKTLTSADVVKAMKNAGPIDRPEVAPFDFDKLAFPDISALASFRIFSRDAMVVRVEDEHYERVSSFSNATAPFKLGS